MLRAARLTGEIIAICYLVTFSLRHPKNRYFMGSNYSLDYHYSPSCIKSASICVILHQKMYPKTCQTTLQPLDLEPLHHLHQNRTT